VTALEAGAAQFELVRNSPKPWGMTMTDNAILEILHAIQADLREKGIVLTALRTDLAAFTVEIDGWPDLHFLKAAALAQFRDAGEAREQRRYIEIRLDEIYSAMATGPEITGLRSDVSTSIDRQRELDVRISAIESHLGISAPHGAKSPLAPE
jgi:hypothetical protein